MMVIRRDDGSVSWQMLSIIGVVVMAFSGGAIWIGSIAKQTEINTAQLIKHAIFIDEIRRHDADTTATGRAVDRRLDSIENRFENERRDKKN